MTSDHCARARRYLDAFWDGRWEELCSYLAADAVYTDPLLPEAVKGRDAIRDVLAYCHEWGTYRGQVIGLFGSGERVAVELRIRGTVIAPPSGMSAAVVGKAFDFAEADIFEFDPEGAIVRQSIYADTLTLAKQLGEQF